MSSCSTTCKWVCIVAYVLASLGAIVLYKNRQGEWLNVGENLVTLYAIGGVVTLGCALQWAMKKDGTPSIASAAFYY